MNNRYRYAKSGFPTRILFAWSLSALPLTVLAQTSPLLGQSAAFAVLGGSGVTSTGSTNVTGELGVSPGISVTGFPPGVVAGGNIHNADAFAGQAQADLVAAYDDLAGQAPTAILTGTNLGGLTLGPGVYRFSSSAQLTGTLTLDAQGDPGAVFIFQTGGMLATTVGSRVVLINGGSDCNVYWQIGSSAELGIGSNLVGSILALTSITLDTKASVSGRVLVRNGAVTLDSSTVNVRAAGCAPIDVIFANGFEQSTERPVVGKNVADASGSAGISRVRMPRLRRCRDTTGIPETSIRTGHPNFPQAPQPACF